MEKPNISVRRSVALPPSLIEEAMDMAPPELQKNFNGLVRRLLEAFIEQRKNHEFEQEMGAMAADPCIQREIAAINSEFTTADGDGFGIII